MLILFAPQNSQGSIPRTFSPVPANPVQEKRILLYMKTNATFPALLLTAALVFTPALSLGQTTATQDLKTAGHDTKDAAKDTGHAVKKGTTKAYDKTAHGTKKAYHATTHATKKAAVKTKDTAKGAVEGGKEGAKKPE